MLRSKIMSVVKRSFSCSAKSLQEESTKASGFKFTLEKGFEQKDGEQRAERIPIARHFVRDFAVGSTYDPFDFSLAKINLEKKKRRGPSIPNGLKQKNLNPLDFWTNPRYLSNFISPTGRIYHRDVTKLNAKDQKRLSKAIRRARAAGFLSSVHRDVSFLPSSGN